MSDFDEPLAFADGYASEVSLRFAAQPVLAAAENFSGWMFVNPSVAENDNLVMKVRTDRHLVTVNVAATDKVATGDVLAVIG